MQIDVQMPFLHPWQKDVFDAVINDNGAGRTYVVKAKRQVGKSILAISVLLYFAFKNAGSIGVMVEPTLSSQARRVFKQLLKAVGGEGSDIVKSSNATLLEIEFINGSSIVFKSQEQGETALRGLTVQHSCLVLDEGAFLDPETYEVLDPITDATKNPTLIISTPLFKDSEFFKRYMRGFTDNDFVKSFDWCEYDTSIFLTPEKLEYYRETMTELKFRSEILGQFIDDKSFVFGDFAKCCGLSSKPPKYAGIDWSQGGDEKDDYTVVIFMDEDGAVTDIKSWRKFAPVELVEVISASLNDRKTLQTVQVEKNSIGHIFYDMLRRKVDRNIKINEFVTTNDSKRRIIEQLIKAFDNGEITITDDKDLKKQLQHYGIEKLKSGGYTYNGQTPGVNDDYVMALAFAYDLVTRNKNKKGFQYGFG